MLIKPVPIKPLPRQPQISKAALRILTLLCYYFKVFYSIALFKQIVYNFNVFDQFLVDFEQFLIFKNQDGAIKSMYDVI